MPLFVKSIEMLGLIPFISCAVYEPLSLNDVTFEQQIKSSNITFVMAAKSDNMFTQEVMPTFRAVAEAMKDSIQFVVLEHDQSPKMRDKYGMFAYPSFFVFRHGVPSCEFEEERTADRMLRFLKRITGPAVINLEAARDVHDYLEENGASVVLAGEEIEDSILSVFNSVAANLTDVVSFSRAKTTDAIEQLGLEEVPALQVHRNDDRAVVDFPLAYGVTFEGLRTWILQNLVPKYKLRNGVTFRNLMRQNRFTILAIADTTRPQSLNAVHSVLSTLVSDYGENFSYVYSDVYDMGQMMLQLGFSGAREPVFVILFLGQSGEISERYLFPERKDPSPAAVTKWVGEFMNGTLQPKIKSETIPEKADGPVTKLVGSQFKNATRDPNSDVVVLLLLGTEEQQKKSMAIMEVVAKEFSKQKVTTVKFYHINLAMNDVPGLRLPTDMNGPTFIFFPAVADKQPLRLPEDATPEMLMSVIMTHGQSKPKFKVPKKLDEGSLEL